MRSSGDDIDALIEKLQRDNYVSGDMLGRLIVLTH